MNSKKQSEIGKAFYIVWGIVAIAGLILVLIPFFIEEQALLKTTPMCTTVVTGEGSCAFCGLTRGFIALSKGQIEEALLWNTFSLYIFIFFILNFIIFSISLIYLKNK